jgi:hypothetical protein
MAALTDLRCHCPCGALRCADPSRFATATEQEQVELVAELGCVACALGGTFTPRQGQLLLASLRLLPGMGKLTEGGLDRLLARAVAHSERGAEWLCESAHRIRSAPLKRLGFRLVALLAADHGAELDERQQELLLVLASGFGFGETEARTLLEQATGWTVAA